MNNLYADWRNDLGLPPVRDYAFKCTAASGGADYLPDFRGSSVHHFIATTVDLLTTGVDVPSVKNIVFFRYVNSPISFYQMVGRGTRLHPQTNKLMFRVYDYTDATRLFGEDFKTAFAPGKPEETGEDGRDETGNGEGGSDGTRAIVVEGVDVRISDAGAYIMTTNDDGQAVLVTLEEYKQRLAARLVEDIPALDAFRTTWIDPEQRREMMGRLPDSGRAPAIVQNLTQMEDFDLYDVLAEVGLRPGPKDQGGPGRGLRVQERGLAVEYARPHGRDRTGHCIPVRPGRHRRPGKPPDFQHAGSGRRRGPARPARVRPARPDSRRDQATHVRGMRQRGIFFWATQHIHRT